MSRRRLILSLLALLMPVLAGCRVQPEPIAYGTDACVHCRMSIVDPTHSAQLVTSKGKQHKFDAIECLVQKLPEWTTEEIGLLLVADYAHPATMIDATSATYLISPGIRSPMGANLSAFAEPAAAARARDEHRGEVMGWKELPGALESVFEGL